MAVVAGGVNFCSIARDLRIPVSSLFTRIFERFWRETVAPIFYFYFFYEKRNEWNGYFNFSEFFVSDHEDSAIQNVIKRNNIVI